MTIRRADGRRLCKTITKSSFEEGLQFMILNLSFFECYWLRLQSVWVIEVLISVHSDSCDWCRTRDFLIVSQLFLDRWPHIVRPLQEARLFFGAICLHGLGTCTDYGLESQDRSRVHASCNSQSVWCFASASAHLRQSQHRSSSRNEAPFQTALDKTRCAMLWVG